MTVEDMKAGLDYQMEKAAELLESKK